MYGSTRAFSRIDCQMNDTLRIAFMVLEGVLSEESSLCIVHASLDPMQAALKVAL